MPGPGAESQSVMTWPEGNGRVVNHFVKHIGDHIRCGFAVNRIHQAVSEEASSGSCTVESIDVQSDQVHQWQADRVIFAVPQMLAPYIIRERAIEAARPNSHDFQYGSWLVANVHLRDRPVETGFPMCWDNVIHGSRSLGYVTATRQLGIDHGPTVLTWYHPFADVEGTETRKQMLELTWSDWAAFIVDDLCVAHRDLGALVMRMDVMLWGHAMIQPRVGFIWSPSRIAASRPYGSIHFAGADLSGIALFEEAFYHGIRAAEEVLQQTGIKHDRMLPALSESTT
jgi:hypothetical protein